MSGSPAFYLPSLHSFPTRRSSDLPEHDEGERQLAEVVEVTRLEQVRHRRLSGEEGADDDSERQRRQSRSEEHTSELQSPCNLVCRLLLENKNYISDGCLRQLTNGW